MAIIIEDGTAIANANSYVSVAVADAYFADRNNQDWANLDSTDQKTPYLILACDFLEQMFRMRWLGFRRTLTQGLCWPRSWAARPDANGGYGPFPFYYGFNTIPQEVITAQLLLAVKLVNGDLAPDISREDMANSVGVGPIKIDYNANKPSFTIFRNVEMLLGPLLINNNAQAQVVRT
jgi:hypothetical protein